jgi:serine/threonine protein kinase/formylglycine-generating enzyme required for sulfatase activity
MADDAKELVELTDANLEALEALASQLENAWKKGTADLAAFLPETASPLRKHALIELIKVDLECRWRRGRTDGLDYYTDKFPELGRTRDLPAKLIFEEYRVRHLWGDKPSLTQYEMRFPGQFEQLKRYLTDEPMPTVIHAATVVKPTVEQKNVSKTEHLPPTAPGTGYKDNTRQMGQYRMIERLGSGAFGEVWKAELPGGILKAVKVIFRPIDHDEAKREREALELIKGLRHHFLLQTISFNAEDDKLHILMDLADCSLRDLLKQAKKEGKIGLPLADIAKWLRQAAEALDYLHSKKMQHRDIKPENILLSEGNVRVADFGLARVQQTQRLASASGAGTPLYMPPEAWNDKQHANSDQYSLAATYAECRLGRRIYDSDGLASLMQAHVHEKPKLGSLPADEQKVLLKALAKNPEHRYPSCVEFADDLIRAVAKHLPPGSFPGFSAVDIEHAGATRRAREKQKRLQSALIVAGVLGLFIVAAIIISLQPPKPNDVKDPKDLIALPTAGPAGPFRPVEGSPVMTLGDKKLYKQIECQLVGDPSVVVRFNLIPWVRPGKQSFYLMENKVSNDIYRVFAAADPSAVNGSRWQLGARFGYQPAAIRPLLAFFAGPPVHWNYAAIQAITDERIGAIFNQEDWPQPNDLGADNPRWPVLRVDIQEAHRCAVWLGGVLPSAEQWDKAAGRFEDDRGAGPFEGPIVEPGDVNVGGGENGRPVPVGAAPKDVCRFSGCRDMAGNGLEWTRTLRQDGDASEYFGDLPRDKFATVPLRGRSYKDTEPLTYAYLEGTPVDLAFFQSRRIALYDSLIGFRVALLP